MTHNTLTLGRKLARLWDKKTESIGHSYISPINQGSTKGHPRVNQGGIKVHDWFMIGS